MIQVTRITCVLVALVSLLGWPSIATATKVPITFEDPVYSATFSPDGIAPPGTLRGQNGWGLYANLTGGSFTVSSELPINGLQSLTITGAGGRATSILRDNDLRFYTPTSISWLMRIDSQPTSGNAAASRFETGITVNPTDVNGAFDLLKVVFTRQGGFQFLASNKTAFSELPGTYSVGTVYRVDITGITPDVANIDGNNFGTYDLSVVDTTLNLPVAGGEDFALQSALGTAGVSFLTRMRWTAGGAHIDDVLVSGTTTAPSPLDGDFNGDFKVNAADYVVWRKTLGDDFNYQLWRSNFGNELTGSGSGVGAGAAVPEPMSAAMFVAGGVMISWTLRRRILR